MSDPTTTLDTIVREVDAGRRVAFCVIIATRGSTPQVPGAMACVSEKGEIIGTVGGGMTEADVTRQAKQLLITAPQAAGGNRPTGNLGGVFTFGLDHDSSGETGPICGGRMDVAIAVLSGQDQIHPLREALDQLRTGHPATIPIRVATLNGPVEYRLNLESAPKLVIAGAGHVGRALAAVMPPLGFHVSVIDDRSNFVNAERFPTPVNPVIGDITKTLADWQIDASTYVVIVTRGHQYDEQALGAVLDSPAKYIGMIGSHRKIKTVFVNLRQSGATQQQLDRVHTPIGLAIKAVTPEEIAVSIAAEMISIRRAEHRKPVEGPIAVGNDET